MLLNTLVQLGLSQKEASAYIMLLRVGASPVSSLAKRLDMKRVTLYSVMDSLSKRGYVTFQKTGKCRRYIPLDPECILEDLERKNEKLRMQLTLAKECVEKLQAFPRILKQYNNRTELFIGKEAEEKLMMNVDKDLPIFIISLSNPTSAILINLLKHLRQWNAEVHMSVLAKNFEALKSEFSFISANSLNIDVPLTGDLIVQEGKVLFLSSEEEVQLSVQVDPSYARLLKYLFLASYNSNREKILNGVSDGI